MAMTEKEYLQQLQSLLPQGLAWPRDENALLTKLLGMPANALARVDARSDQLVNEADPRTATEMLQDWERVTGLPDPFFLDDDATQLTTAERQKDVETKLVSIGGQSPKYLIELSRRLGYEITITEFFPFRADMSAADDPLIDDDDVFWWQVNAGLNNMTYFRADVSAADDPLASWGNARLERILNRFKPAHTDIIFAYKGENDASY